jgi:mRNA-degrading endonuclease HigB of HigAB toxin-antitoxin module
MNHSISSLDLEQLNQELEEYCWDVKELTNGEKDDIKNLYKTWKSCLNKKIIIQDLHNTNIRVIDNITYNGQILKKNIKKHHTLHFINCSDSTIIITPKVNHITLENCKNINFRSRNGSISGMDLINSNNITLIINSQTVNFIDVSNTTECMFILSESVAENLIIITTNAYNLDYRLVDDNNGTLKNTFKTNMNMFQSVSIYTFQLTNEDVLSLYIIPNIS